MGELPLPLVPAECDLSGVRFFPLDIDRLLGSQFHAGADDAAWRAGITLWIKAFRQLPAGSLPDDDVALARLADYGRDTRSWRKARAAALRGWVRCRDGRLYHRVVAERALSAWLGRLQQQKRSALGNGRRWGGRGLAPGEVDRLIGECQAALVMLEGSPPPDERVVRDLLEDPPPQVAGGQAVWPTAAGALSAQLRRLGVRVSSSDPVLIGWLEDGFSNAQVLAALDVAREHKPPPGPVPGKYLDKVLRDLAQSGGKGNGRNEAYRRVAAELTGRAAGGGGVVIEGRAGTAADDVD